MPPAVSSPIFNRSRRPSPAAISSRRFFCALSISFHRALETLSPNTLKYTACLLLSVQPAQPESVENETLRVSGRKFQPQTVSRNSFLLAFDAIALLPVVTGCLREAAFKSADEA